jgi:hypothetical protein
MPNRGESNRCLLKNGSYIAASDSPQSKGPYSRILCGETGYINCPLRFLQDYRMGRVREPIQVNGRKYWTLFDTGARNTYVIPAVAAHLATARLPKPFRSALGGGVKKATKGPRLR